VGVKTRVFIVLQVFSNFLSLAKSCKVGIAKAAVLPVQV